jgi:hypothetical protein
VELRYPSFRSTSISPSALLAISVGVLQVPPADAQGRDVATLRFSPLSVLADTSTAEMPASWAVDPMAEAWDR